MIHLSAYGVSAANFPDANAPFIARLSKSEYLPKPIRCLSGFVVTNKNIPEGYSFYICFEKADFEKIISKKLRAILVDKKLEHLSDGDVIRLNIEKKNLRVLYRKESLHNSFLVTERCNHYCLMCSQPPKNVDDSWIVEEILETIPLIDRSTKEIGFTGGEPTLLGGDFLRILNKCKLHLPNTSIHILSNGRKFCDQTFTYEYSQINHPDMMVGIPLYSDLSHIHDYVVQADDAFDETIRGILYLKKFQQKVEIRIVIHKQTYKRLPQLAEFIARNLTFVDHVALMGLEIMGFTKANLNELWIDPVEYSAELVEATKTLEYSGMNVSIYNHQLCTIEKSIWPFARQSISDWKNEYIDECNQCGVKNECGGFFTSQLIKPSQYISAIQG